jgi:ATP-dependent DNA ligase
MLGLQEAIESSTSYPMLYKLSSKGKVLQWHIRNEGADIITEWGEQGGKIQDTSDTIRKGKNIGKKNETTPDKQAELEAKAKWTKKLKTGWVQSVEDAILGKVSDLVEGGVWPMLADKYRDYGHKIVWPCYIQAKFDGHRCVALIEDGKVTLWSKTRKRIYSMPHIVKEIEEKAAALGVVNGSLDGELYNHDYHNNFEHLSHFIRQSKPIEGCEVVQYHIFDTADMEQPFDQRWKTATDFTAGATYLIAVKTDMVLDEDDAMVRFEELLALGYEGAMLRNAAGMYKSHPTSRSKDLLKIKKFDDNEFLVVDVIEGRGRLQGHAVFICKIPEGYEDKKAQVGAEFEAKMAGPIAELKQYWDDPSLATGRMMTVQHQGYTKKSKVPRFPVAQRFREDAGTDEPQQN